jgi:DNA (cytosine-5)-methyltransferase 1
MLILSLFPGIDLLGRGFEEEGYCVVRGPDLIFGQNIQSFHVPAGRFDGIIAGSPCQDFSGANRSAPTGNGERSIVEFCRLVTESSVDWFLLENVPRVRDVQIDGYTVQRFDLNAANCGLLQHRPRHFQFGHRSGYVIQLHRSTAAKSLKPTCMATEGTKRDRRSWSEFCQLQGLPADFDLPGWSTKFKYRAVGNGVPIPMARMVARAIKAAAPLEQHQKLCVCGCGRIITSKRANRILANCACRKRMQRRMQIWGFIG